MIIMATSGSIDIRKLELDAISQSELCNRFSELTAKMYSGKTKTSFDGYYKPLEDECLFINNFQLCDEIKNAIRNPLGVSSFLCENNNFPEIKAIFIGNREEKGKNENFTIAFQRFRKEQYISPVKRINLFFESNTFVREKRFGITISDFIDCYFTRNELQFLSYYYARQIFDLSDYYRSATDQEVYDFSQNKKLFIDNTIGFQELTNSWIRRKIASINDSGVLNNFPVAKIKLLAKKVGINITIENDKIVIPTSKDSLKIILGFLDEEAYLGPFSQNTFLANSKRKI